MSTNCNYINKHVRVLTLENLSFTISKAQIFTQIQDIKINVLEPSKMLKYVLLILYQVMFAN